MIERKKRKRKETTKHNLDLEELLIHSSILISP